MRLYRHPSSSSSTHLLLRLSAFVVTLFVIQVSSADYQPTASSRKNPNYHPFQGTWTYERRPPQGSQLQSPRLRQDGSFQAQETLQSDYSTLGQVMYPPPAKQGRRVPGNRNYSPVPPASAAPLRQYPQQAHHQSPAKVKGDLQTAGAAPYSVQIDFLDHPYHPHHPPQKTHIHYHHHSKKGHSKAAPKGHPHYYEVHPKAHHPPKYSHYTEHETYHAHHPHPGPVYYVDDGHHHHAAHADHYSSYGPKGGHESYPGQSPVAPPSHESPKGPPPAYPRDPSSERPPSSPPGPFPRDPEDPTENPNPPTCFQEFGDRNITRPEDLDSSWFLVDDQRNRVDPFTVLSPPLALVPSYPRQFSTDELDQYETTFVERLSMDFEESARNAGFSVIRDRASSLFNVTSDIAPASSDSVTSVVTIKRAPKIDAPLTGVENQYFKAGLRRARAARDRTDTRPPVENVFLADLHTMTNLFQDLWNYEMNPEEIEINLFSKQESPNVLQMPMMVSRSERFSIPEPDHSERTVLDAAFNFGLPASRNQFESHTKLVDEWKQTMGAARAKFLASAEDLVEVYTGMSQFYDSLEDFTRSRTVLQRNFGEESFIRAEEIAQSQFKTRQFLVCTDRDNDPTCQNSRCLLDPIEIENMRVDGRGGTGGGMRPPRRSRSESSSQS